MEPRGATARYDPANDHYTLRSCSQGAGPQREQLITMMGLPREKVRVVTEDVGGAFGLKTPVYPEYPALLIAAKLTGRPVAWMATRRNPSSATSRRATRSRRPSSRSTPRASSSRCG